MATTTIRWCSTPGVRDAEDGSQRFFTSGGRVLACVGIGDEVDEARDKAYRRAAEIRFEGAYYRRDIADLRAAKATAIRIADQPITSRQ